MKWGWKIALVVLLTLPAAVLRASGIQPPPAQHRPLRRRGGGFVVPALLGGRGGAAGHQRQPGHGHPGPDRDPAGIRHQPLLRLLLRPYPRPRPLCRRQHDRQQPPAAGPGLAAGAVPAHGLGQAHRAAGDRPGDQAQPPGGAGLPGPGQPVRPLPAHAPGPALDRRGGADRAVHRSTSGAWPRRSGPSRRWWGWRPTWAPCPGAGAGSP